MLKIVLDTNVLISAIVFGGKPKRILETVINRKAELALSEAILEEFRGVLEGPKFRFSAKTTQAILSELITLSEISIPTQKLDVVKSDPEDNRILECALAAKADLIVSGDSDLLALKEFRGILILSPDQFYSKYLKEKGTEELV